MNLYYWSFLFSFGLLFFLFILRRNLRRKEDQKAWLERLETIARDNHTVWSTQVPYPQISQIAKELVALEEEQQLKGNILQITENGDWSSPENLLKYPYIKRLFKKLIPQITAYSRTLGLDPKFLTLSAWAEINRSSIQPPQSEDALFSGSYFLKSSSQTPLDGGISFYKKEEEENLFAHFSPHVGGLLLYPSDMKQKSLPFHSEYIAVRFHVYFGNRKKSWFISKIETHKEEFKPQFDEKAEVNFSKHSKEADLELTPVHVSKIKNKLLK